VAVFQIAWQEKGKSKMASVEAKSLVEAIEKVRRERPRAKHVRGSGASGAVRAT
jgi:hypothetical protein